MSEKLKDIMLDMSMEYYNNGMQRLTNSEEFKNLSCLGKKDQFQEEARRLRKKAKEALQPKSRQR